MKIKTSELQGIALDWAVGKCERLNTWNDCCQILLVGDDEPYHPSTDWAQGGPIIERGGICIEQRFGGVEGAFAQPIGWRARRYSKGGLINPPFFDGETLLIATMRCYVASKLGDVVDVPNELLEN